MNSNTSATTAAVRLARELIAAKTRLDALLDRLEEHQATTEVKHIVCRPELFCLLLDIDEPEMYVRGHLYRSYHVIADPLHDWWHIVLKDVVLSIGGEHEQ